MSVKYRQISSLMIIIILDCYLEVNIQISNSGGQQNAEGPFKGEVRNTKNFLLNVS